ncbi:MAG: Asp-tRNA(Asn)/Glu-tRNA(Gln) amidotransferase subunit GatB [Congregibacter sp.]
MSWETVIGLEVHLQLATQSKIFSGSSASFGAAPNTQANAVDLAMPGMLPVLNDRAVRFAVMFGLAIDAEIGRYSVFDRKNYFYPDLPKGYQISQFTHPIVGQGRFHFTGDDAGEREIGITRAHLEEDAGKSLHEDFQGMTGIDLNRAGTPLLEIVTDPDFRTAEEAVAFLKALHSLVTYLGISDGNMSQGSMRCDINLSLRRAGDAQLGTRTEIKNVNSFRFVEKAIHYEKTRQEDILEDGGRIVQETRLYDADNDETRSMRSKEVANDYRYFPEPDLLPVVLSESDIEEIRGCLPELPDHRRARFQNDYGLSTYDAAVLTDERAVADFFETTANQCGDAKLAANWIQGELLAALNSSEQTIQESPVSAEQLAVLISRIADQSISGKIAKTVFEAMWNREGDADTIIAERGLKQVSDSGALSSLVAEVVRNNPDQVAQYRAAQADKRKKLTGFFVGQIMKASKGQANPKLVSDLLVEQLDSPDQSQDQE